MPADAPAIPTDNVADAGRKVRLLTLGDLDGRTAAAKSARALIAGLESDLGGADRITAAERVIVGRAAVASAMIEHMEAVWLSGRGMDVGDYCALVNVQRRLLTTVGLQRRARDATPDLAEYVATRAGETVTHAPPNARPVTSLPPLPVTGGTP